MQKPKLNWGKSINEEIVDLFEASYFGKKVL
jgi:hypothetical protein